MPTSSLKIIFAGTPAFAEVALAALIDSPHEIVAVYTQPDRPSGRGLKLTESPVKKLAQHYKLPVFQPTSLKDVKEQEQLAHFQADVMIVAAYGMLLPSAVLNIPRLGCINIHPSLLPRWRGAAPIQRTIFAGDTLTGVTIMQMDQGLDTGPILYQKKYILDPDETSETLHEKLAHLGAETLLTTLALLTENKITAEVQDNALSTYATKICKEEALIDWDLPAIQLEQMIRAFVPWPVAYTNFQGNNLRIGCAKAITKECRAAPRTILSVTADGIDIATGDGVLRLLALQRPGAKMLAVKDFYNAHRNEFKIGEKLL